MFSNPSKKTTCTICGEAFTSRNKYFKHQRENVSCGALKDEHKQPEEHIFKPITDLEPQTQSSPPEENEMTNSLSNITENSSILEIVSAYSNLICVMKDLYLDEEAWCPYGCKIGISSDDIEEIVHLSEKKLLERLNIQD